MGLTCTIGCARGTFCDKVADEVADLIDQSFGAEGEWERGDHRDFGELESVGWSEFQNRAVAELGPDSIQNILAMGSESRGVYLPANVQTVSLPLSEGSPLRCASLTGLRRELFELAERWGFPVDDESLAAILDRDDDGGLADAIEARVFARLMLAANEAMRRDCPLWLVGASYAPIEPENPCPTSNRAPTHLD